MKTGFLFFLQTIYELASYVQIPRAIGAFDYVWKWHNVQRARSEMRRCTTHALYRSKLWQQDHCQHPQNANPYAWGHSSTYRTTLRTATVMIFGVVSSEGHIMPPHIFEVGLKVNNAEECGDPLMQLGGRWQTLGVAAGLDAGQQVQRDPGLASEAVLRLCTLLSLGPLLPWPESAGLLRLVIRREHHQHDLPQHQSQPDHRHPPSIRRAPAGACGKGMLPVPGPYRGGDWGWRGLHWIDVSSITWSRYLNWFFQ